MKNEDLLNHSCPYCGDSEKNQYKARGYHFKLKETFIYKCHNCGVAKPFAKFLKEQDSTLWKQYAVEKFYKKEPTHQTVQIPKSKVVFKDDILKKVGCISAVDSQKARDYLNLKDTEHRWMNSIC